MGCLYYFGPNIQKKNNKIRSHKRIVQFHSRPYDFAVDGVILQLYDAIISQQRNPLFRTLIGSGPWAVLGPGLCMGPIKCFQMF